MDDEPKTQTFINQANDQLVDVIALYHTEARQHVVFMDDIYNAFGVTALTIKNGTAAVPLARHTSYHYIEPRCIVYHPNANLTVTIGEQPPNSNPGRPRTPLPISNNDSTLYEDSAGPAEPLNLDKYAESLVFSEMESNRGDGAIKVGPRPHLEVGTEIDAESEPDMEVINAGIGRLEFDNPVFTAFPATNFSSFESNNDNLNGVGNDRSATPPLSTSSSESATTTGSGVSTSSAKNIPPSTIETANSGTAAATSGTTAVPDPSEIDPVEATSSWASIFRTLGDLQEQYQLTPEETTKMFTEITQSA